MNRLSERWGKLKLYCFLLSMPVIILMLELVMFQQRLLHLPEIWLGASAVIFMLGLLSMDLHVRYDHWVERKFPALEVTRQRILLKSLIVVLIMTPSVFAIFGVFQLLHIGSYHIQPGHLWRGALIGLSINMIFETLFEGDYIFHKKLESAAGNDALQQLSLSQEMKSLKEQINPHFLFNCFNTLSSLIATDKKTAVQFLDELSKVYRSLLRSNQDSLSTLAQELDFMDSFFALLKTRHGEAVQCHVTIDRQYLSYYLPSLSLQLLVENAVKHNMVSKKKPLVIDIFTSGENKLVVNNNLQRRVILAPGNKVGLKNISAKYQLLKVPGFQVMEGAKNFTVVLPLLLKHPQTGDLK